MKRILFVFVVLMAASGLLLAEGTQEQGAATEGAAEVDFTANPDRLFGPSYQLPEGWESLVEGTDSLSHFNYGAMQYDPATQRNGDVFEDLTGVGIEHIVVSFSDMSQKISSAVLSKSSTPDLFQAERHYVRLAQGDFLVNVDELWTDEIWEHYPQWVKDDVEVDGHYYAVPVIGQQWGFYYRPSVLNDAGYSGPPQTKDELVEMAKAVTNKSENIWGYGFAVGDNFAAYEAFLSMLYMQNGRLLPNGELNVETEEAQTALQFLVDLVHKHEVVPKSAVQLKEAELGDMYVGGQIAMMSQWDYHYSRATNPEQSNIADDVGFTVPPDWTADTDGKALADYQILAINKFSENIDAAKLFMDYMRSQQAHSNEFLLEGNDTLVTDVYQSAAAQSEVDEQYLQAHIELADQSIRENYRIMPKAVEIIGSEVQAAVAQQKSVSDALADAQEALEEAQEQ
jgi:multiple sugar transport system substrate-binding protein